MSTFIGQRELKATMPHDQLAKRITERYVLRDATTKRIAARNFEAGLYSFKQVIQKLKSVGSYARKLNYRPESKDNQRIWDLLSKANDDPAKLFALALRMAKTIKKTDKAVRRGAAAENLTKHNLAFDVVAQIFYARALELVGVPAKYPKFQAPTPKPTAPPVPSGLVPTDPDGWQMYDVAGAKGAARSLGKVMLNALQRLGKNVSTSYTTKRNIKAIKAVITGDGQGP